MTGSWSRSLRMESEANLRIVDSSPMLMQRRSNLDSVRFSLASSMWSVRPRIRSWRSRIFSDFLGLVFGLKIVEHDYFPAVYHNFLFFSFHHKNSLTPNATPSLIFSKKGSKHIGPEYPSPVSVMVKIASFIPSFIASKNSSLVMFGTFIFSQNGGLSCSGAVVGSVRKFID